MKFLPAYILVFISISLCTSLPNIPVTLLKAVVTRIITTHTSDERCAADLKVLISDVSKFQFWALKMVDSTAKIPPGVLEGNVNFVGDYDLCLDISEDVDGRIIDGQYCSAIVSMNEKFVETFGKGFKLKQYFPKIDEVDFKIFKMNLSKVSVPWGVCIPKSCNVLTMNHLLRSLEGKFKLPFSVTFMEDLCLYRDKPVEIKRFDYLVYCFFIMVLFVVIGSTAYDIYLRSLDEEPNILVIFSAYTNMKKLVSSSLKYKDDNIKCLNGIKSLTTAWIILAHLVLVFIPLSKNLRYIGMEWRFSKQSLLIASAFYGVDTFVVVTGLLTAYLYLKFSEKNNINLMSFYLKRLIRLLPPLLAITLIHTSLLKLMVDGPYGPAVEKIFTYNCESSWWQIFLFNNNLIGLGNLCAFQTWYISLDMQLYLCAPLILFFIKKYSKKVLFGMLVAFLLALLYCCILTVVNKYGFLFYESNHNMLDHMYLWPFPHLPSWLIGMFFGYLLYTNKVKIPNGLNKILWVISLFTMYKLIVNQIVFLENEYSVYRSALWNTLAKPTWCLAVCFIIFSCANGQGGFINKFLSHSTFKPLNKLGYSMYLTHFPVLLVLFAPMRISSYFENFQLLSRFCGVYIITILSSIILHLGFEAPLIALNDYLEEQKKSIENIIKKT